MARCDAKFEIRRYAKYAVHETLRKWRLASGVVRMGDAAMARCGPGALKIDAI